MTAILDAVRELERLRADCATAKGLLDEEDQAHRDRTAAQRAAVAELAGRVKLQEDAVRALGVQRGLEGEMRPAPGLEVKRYQVTDFDAVRALEWAIEHRTCLQLNVEAFAKIAPVLTPKPAWVTVREELRTTIARDLGAKLLAAELWATPAGKGAADGAHP
jgi:hypothetical protein